MKKIISQTYSIVTENYCRLNFVPKVGVTPGTDNFKALSCDEILARYNVSITGSTITGNRCPSQNQVTASLVCPVVGDTYGGGVVAYVYQPGDAGYVAGECHGIIASVSDQSLDIDWVPFDAPTPYPLLGTSNNIGTAITNTNLILASYGDNYYAANLARNYSSGGYSDFQLPSISDLQKIYLNKTLVGNFDMGVYTLYWSSSEYSAGWVNVLSFNDGHVGQLYKVTDWVAKVRPIRYF